MAQVEVPYYVSVAQVEAAEDLLRELLAAGPCRPSEVRAVAAERGLKVREDAWRVARHRVGVESERRGSRLWVWRLAAPELDGAAVADLLAGIERRLALQVAFDQFLAERDLVPTGEQLTL